MFVRLKGLTSLKMWIRPHHSCGFPGSKMAEAWSYCTIPSTA